MYSLFWKIFLTYWFTILLVELFTAWFTADFSEFEIHPILEQQNTEFITSSEQAVSILTTQGLPGLRNWLSQADSNKAIDDIYVFDQHFSEVNNKALPDYINELLKSGLKNYTEIDPIKNILTFEATTPEGEAYSIISTFEHPHPVKYLLAPQRVIFSIVVSGLICFLLASYFTSPLKKLRDSTQILSLNEFKPINLDDLRHRSDEFGALAHDFENMTKRISELLDSQKQLLRDISHELRSPLTRIQVALDLARNKVESKALDELNRIEREIENLDSLIHELLTFVRLDGNNKDTKTKINIDELLNNINSDLNYEHQKSVSGNRIVLESEKSTNIEGYDQLLHRAIENIIRNACYYSPPQETVHITSAKTETGHVRIQIEDNGPGVPDNMLEKIFDPFVRVSTARESETGGSGIGLAIAKRVIVIHDGNITAANKTQGHGLIVTIELPLTSKQLNV